MIAMALNLHDIGPADRPSQRPPPLDVDAFSVPRKGSGVSAWSVPSRGPCGSFR
jgi:hypothetical protein